MENFVNLLAITSTDISSILKPVTDLINAAVPALLALVAAIGMVWCIVLGVKYAKADDPQEHEKAKKALINAIIGFVLIFVLLAVLSLADDVFNTFWKDYTV